MQHNTGAGTGDAAPGVNKGGDSGSGEESKRRRKRSPPSIFPSDEIIKSVPLKSVFRGKRQSDMNIPQMPSNGMGPTSENVFERIKETFSRIMDTTKEMFQKAQQAMSNRDQKGPSPNKFP